MRAQNTRDASQSIPLVEALFSGTASNGGLWVPETFPHFSLLRAKGDRPRFLDIGPDILRTFLPEAPMEWLSELFEGLYPTRFDHPEITPLLECGGSAGLARTYFLELFHGPTLAFKDLALTLLPHFMRYALRVSGKTGRLLVLTATSGDTGKAALSAFQSIPDIQIFVLYPEGGISSIQRAMMLEEQATNTRVFALKGDFDDAQRLVKSLMNDLEWREELNRRGIVLSTANSINLGRILVQVIYYFSSYQDIVDRGTIKLGDRVNYCVPTGNFGNILAGYYAYRMGLPIGRLVCASNRNRILNDFFRTGVYDLTAHSPLVKTLSPSMDILVSSNLERWIFEVLDREGEKTAELMTSLTRCGRFSIDVSAKKDGDLFFSATCNDLESLETIRETFRDGALLIDPHTAVAVYALGQYRKATGDDTPCVVHSTASPFKFPEAMLRALQRDTGSIDDHTRLDFLSEISGRPLPEVILRLRSVRGREPESGNPEEIRQRLRQYAFEGW